MNRSSRAAAFAALLVLAAGAAAAQDDAGEKGSSFAPSMQGFESALEPSPEPGHSEQLVEGIAAQVGSSVVLVSEVRRLSAPIEERMRKGGAPESEIRKMRSEALDRLIEDRLIDDVGRRYQLVLTEAEVDDAVARKAQDNGLTVEQLRQSVASHGLTFEEYRAQLRNVIERQRVLGQLVRSRVRVDEAEVRALYEQRYANQRQSGSEIHLRHLLIGVSAERMRDQATACRIAGDIRSEILAGNVTFAQAAERLSDTNAERGGDLGWVHAEELAGWMTPAIEGVAAGGLSEVVPMPFGCNLLMVVDRRDFQPVTFEQARPSLEQALFGQKMEQEYNSWMEKLREQVYIERKGTYAEATRLQGRTPRE